MALRLMVIICKNGPIEKLWIVDTSLTDTKHKIVTAMINDHRSLSTGSNSQN